MAQKLNSHGKLQEYNTKDGQYAKSERAEWNSKHGFGKHKLTPEAKETIRKYVEHIRNKKASKTQDKHLGKWTEPPSIVEQMKNHIGVSDYAAEKFVNALTNWTDGIYKEIREAQYNRDETSENYQLSLILEEYIQKAPKWSSKPINRGIKLTQKEIDECSVGSVFNMKGLSSWTSEKSVAEFFAKRSKKTNEKQVLLVNKNGTTCGTSIAHLAKYKEQFEVLVSSEATNTITKKYEQGKYIIIEIEEKTK